MNPQARNEGCCTFLPGLPRGTAIPAASIRHSEPAVGAVFAPTFPDGGRGAYFAADAFSANPSSAFCSPINPRRVAHDFALAFTYPLQNRVQMMRFVDEKKLQPHA
jgi:hypothetical protein